jgi:hypothetical protein
MMSETQKQQILEYMKQGNAITALDALGMFGSFRLGARIYDLKEDGYEIGKRMIQVNTGKWVAEYWLKSKMRSGGDYVPTAREAGK